MAVLDALNWPVLECPQLAGFEVAPEVKDGLKGDLGGVVGGAKGEVYYHKVKLCIGTHMILINAGFSEKLSVAALLGRHGFFEHFSVLFDRRTIHPGFEITRIYRV